MHRNQYGEPIFTEQDLCDLYMQDPARTLSGVLVNEVIEIDPGLMLANTPGLIKYQDHSESVEDFDRAQQARWRIPREYQDFDIAAHVLAKCESDAQLQRAGEELIMYQERDLFPLLIYLKFLVDTMQKNNIVWGVGRGSSTSSFVLYLIGVHRIDSLFYDLSIHEFLK